MYGYIYITENLINGKKYIGKHKHDKFDKAYKGSGRNIQLALEKYGWDNFSCKILEECNSLEELNKAEMRWIKQYNAVESDKFYNISVGGDGNKELTQETIDRIKETGHKIWDSKEYKERHSEIKRNLWKDPKFREEWDKSRYSKYTDEVKRKMSENHSDMSGEKNPFYGKKHDGATRKKMGDKVREAWKSGKFKDRKSRAKEVVSLDSNGNLIKVYKSIQEACLDVSGKLAGCTIISRCCTSGDKSYGRWWKLKQEYYKEMEENVV